MLWLSDVVVALYVSALVVLFAFGVHGLVMLYFYHRTRDVAVAPPERPLEPLPVVTVQLPIYNEVYVVERLIDAVVRLDYPRDKLEIQVLDDSTDETQEVARRQVEHYRRQGYDIHYIHRAERTGYKAGALREGLTRARGEFIAIFDADFIPNPDFLRKTIPYFADPRVGMVQTRWEHLNENYSLLTRAQALALDGHFVIEQQVRYKAGFFINFNGTAGIWRRTCIEDAGNWHSDTLAEDLDLSYRAQLRGWKFVFLHDVTSPAELPADINALKSQQFRWTKGAIEAAKKLLPAVWRASLPLRTKLECTVHLTSNIVFPFIVLVAVLNLPMVLIKNLVGGYDELFTAMSVFVLASVSTFLFYLYSQRSIHQDWQQRVLLFPLFMAGSMGLAINNTKAVLEALIGKRSEFLRTPKYRIVSTSDDWRTRKYARTRLRASVVIELLLGAYFLVGIAVSLYFVELAAIPFQVMFLIGFGGIGYLSFVHWLEATRAHTDSHTPVPNARAMTAAPATSATK
ncbi:MAG: glycosyltransferase family 2 protein [Bacteroidota bacterium]|nr:glycosyltransferase family 2 protein [Candidatus Kapabacteria bacterium]MCS7303228.1 glycosyltransferase family 2 protein [Candidatus Kapabacteria bacterium]MCX7937198.1 glycosyltransferase family 2 protein [Chlorobiota bacterium]MDW8075717.1 glycosyltransferase family 2 protein [Bacteroidota bacterium]MDW8272061.1 glycosyltransferase family 2 protein [Bacteroidota bacterium]